MKKFLTYMQASFKEVFDAIREVDALAKEQKKESNLNLQHNIVSSTTKQLKSISESYQSWWNKENAKWVRSQCNPFMPFLFESSCDYETAFENVMSRFFYAYGNWRFYQQFPDLHINIVIVDVYKLKDTWNRRDLDLKSILLTELSKAYLEYAHSRGFKWNMPFKALISDVWLIENKLFIEFPTSIFPFNHPQCWNMFLTDDFKRLLYSLAQHSKI